MTVAARIVDAGRARLLDAPSGPLIIGHRGAAGFAPGNSLAAFEYAIRQGADAVELDVRQTGDGVLVIHHSATLRGTPIAQLAHADVRRRARHVPPTLAEAADLCAGRVALDVEIKQPGCEAAVLRLLARRFAGDRLLITSFHEQVIATVKELKPTTRRGLLLGPSRLRARARRFEQRPFEWMARSGAEFLVVHQLLVARPTAEHGRGLLAEAERRGVPIVLWTVNGAARLRRHLADPAVAGVVTDVPGLAAELRRGGLGSTSALA